MRFRIRVALFCLVGGIPVCFGMLADGINVRIMPPHKAQFLQYQRFDLRVEATAVDSAGTVSSVIVTLDGRDITSLGVVDSPSPNVRNWTYRGGYLGFPGFRSFAASAIGATGGAATSGTATNVVTVREWTSRSQPLTVQPAGANSSTNPLEAATDPQVLNNLHLGATSPLFHTQALAGDLRRAKNVILLIGDGMGVAHRTAGRVLSKGYTQGKANGTMAMDRLPYNGLLMTSSMNSLITDSAPGAHNYSTGNKTNNGMEGVFPDNTAAEDDNPRIEHLAEFLARNFGMVTGIVTDAFLTDATPAAFLAHTQNRGNGTLVASQYVDAAGTGNLRVMMGGGGYHFVPKSQPGSRRTDERNTVNEFKAQGFDYVETATALKAFSPGPGARLLGIYNIDNMNVAFDKLRLGDPGVTASFPDQPFLKDMTQKAIDVLTQYPNGFFLMIEGAHIDKQAHRMDAERSIYDVIQFDQAVDVALQFAFQTNSDNDPNNDTLVIITADHECSGLALPGVGRPKFLSTSSG